MMVSCILTSYNRPEFVRQALRSVERQTHWDYELIVVDDSTIFDIEPVLREFKFPSVILYKRTCTELERRSTNRLGLNINYALPRALGNLICYLADDDYYFEDWFEQGVAFFKAWPTVLQGFGSLHYSGSRNMDYSQTGGIRFYGEPITDPFGKLDHNQVMHQKRNLPIFWPTTPETRKEPDGHFFRKLAEQGPFYPMMGAVAAVKRLHPKNLQRSMHESLEGIRE